MRTQTLTTALLLAALWLLAANPVYHNVAHAQWTNDPYNGMTIVTNEADVDHYPSVGHLSSGCTIVVWSHVWEAGLKLKYQILDQEGVVLLGPTGADLFDGNWQYGFDRYLIPDGAGGAICVVSDARAGYHDVYGQRFDSLGNPLWGPTGLPLVLWPGSTDATIGDVEPDSTGGAFVGYGVGDYATGTDIYLQKIDNNGQMLWGPTGVPIRLGPYDSGTHRIVRDGAGGALVLWIDFTFSSGFLSGQHFDADGNPLWGANGIPIINQFGQQIESRFLEEGITDGRGGGLWLYFTPGSTNYMNVVRVNGQGHTLWRWTSQFIGSHAYHDMKRLSANNTAWMSVSDNRTGVYVDYLYQFDIQGHLLFPPQGLPYGGNAMCPTADGMMLFHCYQVGQRTRLTAQRVNSRGRVVWTSNVGLGGLTQGGGPIFGAFASTTDGADGAVLAFEDRRNEATDPDISAQRVQWNGRLGNPAAPPPAAEVAPPALQMLNPGQVQFVLPQAGEVKLELFDLLGRRVATLENGYRAAGEHTLRFDQKGLPSGVYLLRLQAGGEVAVRKVMMVK